MGTLCTWISDALFPGYMCIWWKSSLPSCSWKRHTVIKQITRAAQRRAASNCICWIQNQHRTTNDPHLPYPGDESPLNLCFIILTQERIEALPWTLNERPPTCPWPPLSPLRECSLSRIWLLIHNLRPLTQGQDSMRIWAESASSLPPWLYLYQSE